MLDRGVGQPAVEQRSQLLPVRFVVVAAADAERAATTVSPDAGSAPSSADCHEPRGRLAP